LIENRGFHPLLAIFGSGEAFFESPLTIFQCREAARLFLEIISQDWETISQYRKVISQSWNVVSQHRESGL